MPRPRLPVPLGVLGVLALGLAIVTIAGCTALAGAPPAQPVIVEGVIVPGDTLRVEPLDGPPEEWTGSGLAATITFETGKGERIEVFSDEHGRFRAGPLALTGELGDRLLVACPGRLGLCFSALDAPAGSPRNAGTPAVVRWRISLPDRQPAG